MSIFRSIMDGVSRHVPDRAAADAPRGAEEAGAAPLSAAPDSAPQAPGHTASAQPVDVVGVLAQIEAESGRSLNWRQSIVDLMELLGLDSSPAARRRLAEELGYAGPMEDGVAMNIGLHRKVMAKLAENGCRVPEELR